VAGEEEYTPRGSAQTPPGRNGAQWGRRKRSPGRAGPREGGKIRRQTGGGVERGDHKKSGHSAGNVQNNEYESKATTGRSD